MSKIRCGLLARGLTLTLFLMSLGGLAHAGCDQFGAAPDNDQELLLSVIRSAQSNLKINIYEFRNTAIKDALVAQIRAGVTLEILVEGQPVGGVASDELAILNELRSEMVASKNKQNALYIMTSPKGGTSIDGRRFIFNHAKYVLVDQKVALVASENFSTTSHPAPGTMGNRGWEVKVCDLATVQELDKTFISDTNVKEGDVIRVNALQSMPVTLAKKTKPEPAPRARSLPPIKIGTGVVNAVEVIASPHSGEGIVKMIQTATKSVDVEHMTLPHLWKDKQGKTTNSPIIDAILGAARRGLKVRVIVNDPVDFGPSTPPRASQTAPAAIDANILTLNYLNSVAAKENLNLEARLIGFKKLGLTYVHNKGVITDRAQVLVSSINGTQNSVENNREIALRLQSQAAGRYYGDIFDLDWSLSDKAPPAVIN